jgi:catechol 2,3-dioxygenase-like lactoylglutathione lyase family enzyme
MPPSLANGKICYVEVPAVDVPRSVAFYEAVFGWRTRRRGDGQKPIGAGAPEVTARFRDPAGNVLGLYQEPDAPAAG